MVPIPSHAKPHVRQRLLVVLAMATALLGFFAADPVDGTGDAISRLVAGVLPAIPLLARNPRTFRKTCVIEGLTLIVIGFWLAIGGLFILIPSALVLILAAYAGPTSSRWHARILTTAGALIAVATGALWVTEIHW